MTDKLKRALTILRFLDENGNLSLTNIALMLTLGRLISTPNLALPDLVTLLATVAGYQLKRFASPTSAPEDLNALRDTVAALQTKVAAVQMSNSITAKR